MLTPVERITFVILVLVFVGWLTTTGFYGYLENGKYWTQERYTKDLMVFRLENVCLVVSGYGTWDC